MCHSTALFWHASHCNPSLPGRGEPFLPALAQWALLCLQYAGLLRVGGVCVLWVEKRGGVARLAANFHCELGCVWQGRLA